MGAAKNAYLRRRNQERRAALRSAGLCVDCGKADAAEGHTLCQRCMDARVERHNRRYVEGLQLIAMRTEAPWARLL